MDAMYGSWVSPIDADIMTKGNCRKILELALDVTDFGAGKLCVRG
jgi:hypothetical protein